MIINENNKNTILKGIVKRGFNQDPNELREKLYNSTHEKTEEKQIVKVEDTQKYLRETLNKLRNLKWTL